MGAKKNSPSGGSVLLPGLLALAVLGGIASAFDVFGSAAAQSRDQGHETSSSTGDETDREKDLARDTKRWLERVRPSRPAASDIVAR